MELIRENGFLKFYLIGENVPFYDREVRLFIKFHPVQVRFIPFSWINLMFELLIYQRKFTFSLWQLQKLRLIH